MEPALKQRLIGAAVLVALAVIFLPMLIKGPAPESGASDVPLTLPDAPKGQFETRELPLVAPGETPKGGAVGMDASADGAALPTVDTSATTTPAATAAMQPAATGGGDYAVSFGSYASAADAQRVVKALQNAQLPGYQEAVDNGGRTLYRVRIGPYTTQPEAEAARLQSNQVRTDVNAKVVTLDVGATPAATATTPAPEPVAPAVSKPAPLATASQPVVKSDETASTASVSAATPLKTATSATTSKPVALPPEPAKPAPAATKPAPAAAKPATTTAAAKPAATPAPAKAAASEVGFAVQLGAFGNAADADKLRDRARASGFSAFVEQIRTDKGMLNRVRIGPVVSRAEADQLKAQVAAKLGVDGIVRPHP
jgi:cell division septation protein DedD